MNPYSIEREVNFKTEASVYLYIYFVSSLLDVVFT